MRKQILVYITAAAAALFLIGCGETAATPEITVPDSGSAQEREADTADADTSDADASGADASNADASASDAADDTALTAQSDSAELSDADSANADEELTDDSIGPVSFTPNEKGYSMIYGSNTLHAYFKRRNVVPGTGALTVRNAADNSVVEEINLLDEDKCRAGEQDSTFSLLGWDGGTHLIIQLNDLPESGEAYYVTLEEGAFTSADGAIRSKAVTDSSTWRYGVADYGIDLSLSDGSDVYVGDVLTANILIREPAACAKIENYDENRVRFNDKEFKEDGRLEIKIYQIGEDSFTVTFYDDDDDPLGSIVISYTASMPPEPEEEAPRKSVTNL